MNKVNQYKFSSYEIKGMLLEKLGIEEEHHIKIRIAGEIVGKKIRVGSLNEVIIHIEEVTE